MGARRETFRARARRAAAVKTTKKQARNGQRGHSNSAEMKPMQYS